jgi:TonB family protein
MAILHKLLPSMLLLCGAVWAQSGSGSTPGVAPKTNPTATSQAASQTAADSSQNPSSDRTPPTPPPDSTKLEPIKVKKAVYPYEAGRQKLQGEVVVKILVSESGDVESAEVVSGDPLLAKSALDAVRKWKFKPYIKNGKPVKVATKLPFDFAFSDKVEDSVAKSSEPQSTDDTDSKPVHVGAGVTSGLLIHKVNPIYPDEALRDRIQGTVVLRAIIGKDGRIDQLSLVSGHRLLAPAAIGAVQQWRYKPYLLNGEPVKVDTEVQGQLSNQIGRSTRRLP